MRGDVGCGPKEIKITNTGEIIETLNIASNMTQDRLIDGDDKDTEKDVTDKGEILEIGKEKL